MTPMEDSTPSSNEPAFELFDRWLSHRATPASETRVAVGPDTPDAGLRAEQVALAERIATEARRAEQVRLAEELRPPPAAPLVVREPQKEQSQSRGTSVSRLARLGELAQRLRRAPEEPEPDATVSGVPRVTLVSSSARQSPEAPASDPVTRRAARAPRGALPARAARAAAPTPTPTPTPTSTTPVDNGSVVFKPKRGARRLVGLLLLVSLVATGLATYAATETRTTNTIAVAVTLGALTLVLWALRAGSAAPRLSVSHGQLEVLSPAGRFVFDLASPYTPIEVLGTPGRRGWKVLFVRRGMSPFVVDSSMVDAEAFMTVLRRHRPERDG